MNEKKSNNSTTVGIGLIPYKAHDIPLGNIETYLSKSGWQRKLKMSGNYGILYSSPDQLKILSLGQSGIAFFYRDFDRQNISSLTNMYDEITSTLFNSPFSKYYENGFEEKIIFSFKNKYRANCAQKESVLRNVGRKIFKTDNVTIVPIIQDETYISFKIVPERRIVSKRTTVSK